MGMSRCYSLMKCLLILFNIIFLCVGGGACGFAVWALWEGRGGGGGGGVESGAAAAGLAALAAWGGALALGAGAGLCGAARGGPALLAGAFSLLALTGVAEAAAAWWGAHHRPQLARALTDALHHTVTREYGVLHTRTQLLDVIQQGLECCGAEGPRDWQQSAWGLTQGSEGDAGAAGAAGGEGSGALDLSVSAPTTYYWVPPSCCINNPNDDPDEQEASCRAGRRVGTAGGVGAGLHGAACGPRVLAALGELARAPLALGAALLALHALALPLTLALWLRATPHHHYKA